MSRFDASPTRRTPTLDIPGDLHVRVPSVLRRLPAASHPTEIASMLTNSRSIDDFIIYYALRLFPDYDHNAEAGVAALRAATTKLVRCRTPDIARIAERLARELKVDAITVTRTDGSR